MLKTKEKILIFLFLILWISGQASAEITAIRAGNLIDPANGKIAQNQIILVKNGKIEEMGPSIIIPDGAQVIDLSKTWVMPGLMDAHTHLTLNFQYIGAGLEGIYLKESTAMRALHGLRTAQDVLHVSLRAPEGRLEPVGQADLQGVVGSQDGGKDRREGNKHKDGHCPNHDGIAPEQPDHARQSGLCAQQDLRSQLGDFASGRLDGCHGAATPSPACTESWGR